jgi:DNA sulfur modification protein DndC
MKQSTVINEHELDDLSVLVEQVCLEYTSSVQTYPWIVAFSGGKDSTLIAHIVFEALLKLPPSLRVRPIYFVSNDTLVESPLVVKHMRDVLMEIQDAANILKLPIYSQVTTPALEQTFWTLLIGKGYPSPNRNMRWCTDRLKIKPTSQFILDRVRSDGSAIIVLGVRKAESSARRAVIESHQNQANSNLTPHGSLTNALVYRPIADLSTDEVWEILASHTPPWGGQHRKLIQLYRDAAGGECPVVLSQDEAPGCGTNSSRFGCWTCTVVDKDKSLQGFVDVGKTQFQPLLEFRDWLVEIRNKPEYRQNERRNGQMQFRDGKHIPGPFTIEARKMILNRLLEVQAEYGEPLISAEEIELIRSIWTDDILNLWEKRYA